MKVSMAPRQQAARWSFAAAIIGALGVAHAAKPAQKLEFKSLVLGEATTPEKVIATLGRPCAVSGSCPGQQNDPIDRWVFKCRRITYEGSQSCHGATTIMGADAFADVDISDKGKLERIAVGFDSAHYTDVVEAFEKKFGPAQSVEHSKWPGEPGVVLDQDYRRWNGVGRSVLTTSRYGGYRLNSQVIFNVPAGPKSVPGDI